MTAELIAPIEKAFAAVEAGPCGIHEAEALDSYPTGAERAAAQKADTYAHWTDIPGRVLEECSTALSYLDPKSWRFRRPDACDAAAASRALHRYWAAGAVSSVDG